MKLNSHAFQSNQPIPAKYTCQGADVSPPLSIEGLPPGAKSIAIVMDDPDAPGGTFDHWIAWNIPVDTLNISEGYKAPNQGTNHFGKKGYGGPCPPPGNAHHYHIKVYALDTKLNLPDGASKEQLATAMQGHILGKAELVGTFKR